MSLTWGDVQKWSPAALDTAETELKTARTNLTDLADELETMGTPANWSGSASRSATTKLGEVSQDLKDLVAEVSAAYKAVADAADGVRGVQSAVATAVRFAEVRGLTIASDGTVTGTLPPVCYVSEHAEELAKQELKSDVEEGAARVSEALRKAADVDADLGAVLTSIRFNRIVAGTGSLLEAARLGEVKGDLSLLEPPKGGTPAQNAAWWATLSPDERAEIIKNHPEWIGNLDGVDFASRDEANRNLLASHKSTLEARRAEINRLLTTRTFTSPYDPIYLSLVQELGDIQGDLEAIKAVEELAALPNRHIALLDLTTPRPQAAVAIGDLDTADHVAVFTPGLTSTVPGMGGYDSDLAQLKFRTEEQMAQAGQPGTVATVVWLGYQAPQLSPGSLFSGNSVGLSGAAEDGGRSLANFLTGINTSRLTDPDLTAIGHSYGSTTTGYALQQPGTGVDRAVFFGSPGLGTSDIDDLKIPSGSSYYLEAKWDGVGDLGRFGTDPTALQGMNQLNTSAATVGGTTYSEVTGHTSYLTDQSTSQYNMAQVIRDAPQEAVAGANVGWASDPLSAQEWIPEWLRKHL